MITMRQMMHSPIIVARAITTTVRSVHIFETTTTTAVTSCCIVPCRSSNVIIRQLPLLQKLYEQQQQQYRTMMARTRHYRRKLPTMIVDDHLFSPRHVRIPGTTTTNNNKSNARKKDRNHSDDYFLDDDLSDYTTTKGSSSSVHNSTGQRQHQQQQHQHQHHRSSANSSRNEPHRRSKQNQRPIQHDDDDNDDDDDDDNIKETERMMEMIHSILPPNTEEHLHYCIKQHLWYRVKPLLVQHVQEEEKDYTNNYDNSDTEDTDQVDKYLMIEVGLAERSLQSVGDILYMSLYPKPITTATAAAATAAGNNTTTNNNKQQGTIWKLPDLTSHRDTIEPYKKSMITSNVPYKEGELFFTIIWEGIEKEKGDEHDFYLVTGRNIWRCPIDGIVSLNEQYLHRNWAIDRPDTTTPLLSIICTKDDYYHKISQMYDGPIIIPDIENSTKAKRIKRRVDKSYNTNATNDGPFEQYYYPWISPKDYDTYIEANAIL